MMKCRWWHTWTMYIVAFLTAIPCNGKDGMQDSMELYSPKSCKFNLIPSSLSSRAYTAYTGEVHVHDVFGLPSTVKRHVMQLDLPAGALLTLQAEVHRDTPTTLSVDAYRRGEVGKAASRVLFGKNLLGSGGDETKAFLHGKIDDDVKEVDIVFELISVEVAARQVDGRISEARCWPVRLDLAAVPLARATLHLPSVCPERNSLPPPLSGAIVTSQVVALTDTALSHDIQENGKPYSFRLSDERPWQDFGRSLWSVILEVPPRLHRFVRLFLRASFRFSSGPLQLVIELFDIKDTPDGTALAPKCAMGCLGGVPVHNGQIIDHAMPTGFRYRLWVLAASLPEWTAALPQRGRHCLEFDFDYKIKFEERMTPFEVGPQAWLCEFARLPSKIVQIPHPTATEKLNSVNELVAGRTIWIRDRFGFPPDEVADMEHTIVLEVSEPCVFRATTHHSDGVDVFVALRDKGGLARACKTVKHPGPVPRQTIFCVLQPGTYNLIFFADYPLGGLHPCSDFFAQIALRPLSMSNDGQTKQCIESSTDLAKLEVAQVSVATVTPRWKAIKVPITFSDEPATTPVWSQEVVVTEEDSTQRLYLRLVLNSDYVSSDIRFQVKYEGKYIADTQVTAHGYADMIGPLDPGDYTVEMYYVTGTGMSKDTKLCSTSMVDIRLVSRAKYENRTGMQWLCTSTRVPPPDLLTPQPDEQVLIDAEYVIPELGRHDINVKFNGAYLLRVKTSSAEADFRIELRRRGEVLGKSNDALEYSVVEGTYTVRLVANVNGLGGSKTCPTFLLMLLLQPRSSVPVCPWAPSSTDQSEASEAQRRAEDHLGNVKLDLVPKELTKELDIKPPTSFWMSPDMKMKFDLEIKETSAVRIDVAVQPPFLPLDVTLRKVRDSGKIEAPVATATWTEARLLLKNSDVPRGKYVIEFSNTRKYLLAPGVDDSSEDLKNLCAHVTIAAEVGISSKQAVNSMRSELLDLPDLLAVQPFPQTFNNVGWFSTPLLPVIGTQVYTFGEGQGGNRKATLKLEEKAVVRVVCEPADLSNSEITAELQRDGQALTVSDNLGQLIGELDAGSYTVEVKPQANAPFLVTLGIATESRIREDLALLDSHKPCLSTFPALASGVDFSKPHGWTIGPKLVRLKPSFLDTEGLLGKLAIRLQASSILYMEVGSALPLDLIRIALQVPEGLWVGEQRGLRNSLEIELPPGKYTVNIAQPKPSRISVSRDRCLDFSVLIRATPVSPDAKADAKEADAAAAASGGMMSEEGKVQELDSREEGAVESAPCFSMGTVPLPLDISDPEGGSKILGGPIGTDGRLLIRTHAMLTDMHDGRKKMYLGTNGRKLQMKVGVIMAGYARLSLASSLTFTVQPTDGRPLDALETWTSEEGWERVYTLEGSTGVWISFHHGHRERGESACLHFGLELEIHPYEDAAKMIDCEGPLVGQAKDPQEMFPESLDVNQAEDESKPFRFAKSMAFLRQVQRGFLRTSRFSLRITSWVGIEVGYNFFTSHAEMDIVRAESPSGNTAIATSELDFLHNSSNLLNTRLHVGVVLEPGDYIIRIADDHYADQLGSSSTACFPFNFEVRIVPQRAAPTVLSVQPHPSVPIPRGVDLVVTIRFSEPPAGSVQDVVNCIYLGGVRAATGGSLNSMGEQFATDKKRTIVQATTGEGHLVWVIGWSAQVVAKMTNAKLRIVGLKSNVTQKLFRFNPPTYSIVEVPPGRPWSGGGNVVEPALPQASASSDGVEPEQPEETVAGTGSAADASEDAGAIKAEKGSDSSGASKSVGEIGGVRTSGGAAVKEQADDQGEPKPESSAGQNVYADKDSAGEIHVEGRGGSSRSVPSPRPSPRPAPPLPQYPRRELPSADQEKADEGEDLSSGAQAQEYNPMDGSEQQNTGDTSDTGDTGNQKKSSSSTTGGGSADDLGNAEGAAAAAAGAVPVGYRSVLTVCGISAGLFVLAFCGPRIQAALFSKQASTPSSRFRDIGARTSEEEIGLVSAADRWGGDEDML